MGIRTRITHNIMDEGRAQLTLQTWMSAAFPIGAFSYSHGLESAIADGRINNASSCEQWIAGIFQYGSGWNDAICTSHAYSCIDVELSLTSGAVAHDHSDSTTQALRSSLQAINDLALALCAGAERRRETIQQGHAFATAAAISNAPTVLSLIDHEISLPVAVGAQGALTGISLNSLLPACIQANASNLVWICTRLIPLGQTQALQIIANLQTLIIDIAQRAVKSSLSDLGGCALLADLASIEHERLYSRVCIT